LNKKGPLWIKNELTNKGISPALVTRAITSISEKEMEEKIVQIIESLERLNKTKTIKQLKNSIIRTLLTKGYQMDVILPVLNHYPFEAKPVNEEQLLQKELLKVVKRLKRKYNGYDLKTRVTSSLLTKGFEFEAIASAYGQLDEEIE
jgi:regulatory protein